MVRLPVCPRCNHEYADFPALSRVDNRTEICSACGRTEALYDYYRNHTGKPTASGFADFLTLVQPIATPIEKAPLKKAESKRNYNTMRTTNGNATKQRARVAPATEPENAMFFEKEDITLLYNALRSYKPAEEELVRHGIWLEGFAQVLACDFDEDLEIPY